VEGMFNLSAKDLEMPKLTTSGEIHADIVLARENVKHNNN
jgi:hypothetical protein